jgi:hypothetical protein
MAALSISSRLQACCAPSATRAPQSVITPLTPTTATIVETTIRANAPTSATG